MVVNNLPFGKPLGTRGADVVRIEHLKHIGTRVTHQGTDADNDQCDDRQNQMVRFIQELPPCAELVVVAPDKAKQVKPAQLDREYKLEQGGKEEGRQRDTGKRQDGNCVVRPAVLLGSGNNAERDGNKHLKQKRNAAHGKRQPDTVIEFFKNGNRIEPAVAKLAAQGVA